MRLVVIMVVRGSGLIIFVVYYGIGSRYGFKWLLVSC